MTSRVKFWPAAYHLSNAYCYCKMIRCYNPVAGKISKMPQKIYFSCFLGTKFSDFCFLFPFSSNRHSLKGSADDLPPLTLS